MICNISKIDASKECIFLILPKYGNKYSHEQALSTN